MKAQLEETVDAAVKVGLLRDELMADDALRRGEDYLRLTIDTIPTFAWCNRPDGSNEFLNQRWLDYTGLSIAAARDWGWKVPFTLKTSRDCWRCGKSCWLPGSPGSGKLGCRCGRRAPRQRC